MGQRRKGWSVSWSVSKRLDSGDRGRFSRYRDACPSGGRLVTEDGAETDLDLGHYQRFTNCQLSQKNNFTTGRIYHNVITKETNFIIILYFIIIVHFIIIF